MDNNSNLSWQKINENCASVIVHNQELFVGCYGVIKVYNPLSKVLYRKFGKEDLVGNWVRGLVIYQNNLLVTDQTSKLHIFSINGKHYKSITVDGMVKGSGMSICNQKLFICDAMGHCVKVVDPGTGKLLGTIGLGSKGEGKDQFDGPRLITSTNNRLYVTEFNSNRVKVMDEHGTFIDQFSASTPTGIAIYGKYILVSEFGENQVSLYDENHKFVKFLLKCSNPYGIFITSRGQIIVAATEIHMSGTFNFINVVLICIILYIDFGEEKDDDQLKTDIETDTDTTQNLREQLKKKDELIRFMISTYIIK